MLRVRSFSVLSGITEQQGEWDWLDNETWSVEKRLLGGQWQKKSSLGLKEDDDAERNLLISIQNHHNFHKSMLQTFWGLYIAFWHT